MSTSVLTREPAQSAFSGQLLAAHAEALFTSNLSARREHTQIEIASAVMHAIGNHRGIRGCAGEVAAAFGEHPETAARRMRWARSVVADINTSACWLGATS